MTELGNRRLDNLGRIVLPAEARAMLHLGEHGLLNIQLDSGRVILTPVPDTCELCGNDREIRLCGKEEHKGHRLCSDCRDLLGIE